MPELSIAKTEKIPYGAAFAEAIGGRFFMLANTDDSASVFAGVSMLRIRCDRCGKDRLLVETHFDCRDMLLREIIKRMRHDGCGGQGGRVELMTGIEGVTSRPVRRIAPMEGWQNLCDGFCWS